jgi:hypothetical protein
MTGASATTHLAAARWRARVPVLGAAMLPLLAAVGVALATNAVQRTAPSPEAAVMRTALLFGVLGGAWIAAAAAARRRASVGEHALNALLGLFVLLLAVYFFWAGSSLFFPADVLLWSETPFVNDILKLRKGLPLYGSPADLDSFFYTPGSQLLTDLIARSVGLGLSIPAYRVIQLVYVTLAVLVSVRTTWRLTSLAGIASPFPGTLVTALWAVILFLCATNALTNPFSHLLHNDSLGLLVSAVAFAVLVEYATTRRAWLLAVAAVLPALGFLVKQSLGIWAGLFCLHLLLFDHPRSWRRLLLYAAGAGTAVAAAYGICLALWGSNFHYWVVTSMQNHPVSPLRAFQHALDSWAYLVAAVLGGAVLVMQGRSSAVLGPWIIVLGLLATEVYTSGIAWMLNHIGPGSLLAGILFCSALLRLWPQRAARTDGDWSWRALVPAGSALAATALAANGLGLVRIPLPSVGAEHARYVSAIESEFAGLPSERVLLDMGTWVYLKDQVVMKDRAGAVGELGNNGVGDFSGLLTRIGERRYARILMRDYDSPEFSYDHFLWPRSSGIRAAVKANYRVVRVIPGIETGWRVPALHPISVLEPLPSQED